MAAWRWQGKREENDSIVGDDCIDMHAQKQDSLLNIHSVGQTAGTDNSVHSATTKRSLESLPSQDAQLCARESDCSTAGTVPSQWTKDIFEEGKENSCALL